MSPVASAAPRLRARAGPICDDDHHDFVGGRLAGRQRREAVAEGGSAVVDRDDDRDSHSVALAEAVRPGIVQSRGLTRETPHDRHPTARLAVPVLRQRRTRARAQRLVRAERRGALRRFLRAPPLAAVVPAGARAGRPPGIGVGAGRAPPRDVPARAGHGVGHLPAGARMRGPTRGRVAERLPAALDDHVHVRGHRDQARRAADAAWRVVGHLLRPPPSDAEGPRRPSVRAHSSRRVSVPAEGVAAVPVVRRGVHRRGCEPPRALAPRLVRGRGVRRRLRAVRRVAGRHRRVRRLRRHELAVQRSVRRRPIALEFSRRRDPAGFRPQRRLLDPVDRHGRRGRPPPPAGALRASGVVRLGPGCADVCHQPRRRSVPPRRGTVPGRGGGHVAGGGGRAQARGRPAFHGPAASGMPAARDRDDAVGLPVQPGPTREDPAGARPFGARGPHVRRVGRFQRLPAGHALLLVHDVAGRARVQRPDGRAVRGLQRVPAGGGGEAAVRLGPRGQAGQVRAGCGLAGLYRPTRFGRLVERAAD